MRATLRLALLLMVFGMPLLRSAEHSVPATGDYGAVDEYVRAQLSTWKIPGAAIVIVKNGEVAHLQAFGDAGRGRPVTRQTPFEIGSCTKSFTALAAMQLVEAGELNLDAPVQQYLPWFRAADEEASGRITIRHLLNQTSGISQADSNRLTTKSPHGKTLEDQVRLIGTLQLTAQPGTLYQYANLNYMTLALVIEQVSGQTYGEYLQTHLFEPLGMKNSYTDRALAEAGGLSQGHTWWFGVPLPSLEGARPDELGAGYVMVSAEDMARYLLMQLNGGTYNGAQLISPEGMTLMHTPPTLEEGDTVYAMGWTSFEQEGERVINHNGQSASFTCSMILLPEENTGIAVLANVSSSLGPHAAASLAFNVRSILEGKRDASVDAVYRGFYLPWDGGFLLASTLLVWSLFDVPRWAKKVQSRPEWQGRWAAPALDLLLLLAVLLGMPLALGVPIWQGMFVWQPEAVYWCLAASLLLLGKLAWRLGVLARLRKPIQD